MELSMEMFSQGQLRPDHVGFGELKVTKNDLCPDQLPGK